MRRVWGVFCVVFVACGMAVCGVAGVGLAVGAQGQGGSAKAGGGSPAGVVVVFDRGMSGGGRSAMVAGAHTKPVRTLGRERFQLLAPEPGQTVQGAVAALRRTPGVEAVGPNRTVTVADVPNPSVPFVPNDPLFGEEWGLQNTGQQVPGPVGESSVNNPGFIGTSVPGADIDATLAWDRTTGDPSTVVADIDTGYFFEHPDLPGTCCAWDTLYNNNDATDDGGVFGVSDGEPWLAHGYPPGYFESLPDSHGVNTAGIIGARRNNGIGVSGVDPNVTIMPIRAIDSTTGEAPLTSVIEAMNYSGLNGARAANMSLESPGVSTTVLAAQAANPETLFVVVAGNTASNDDTSPNAFCGNPTVAVGEYTPPPGAVDSVVCVAATEPADSLALGSNWGSNWGPTSVDLAAPGVDILSTQPELTLHWASDFSAAGFSDWTTPSPPADEPSQGFTLFGNGIWNDPETQTPGSTRATQSPAIALPEDATACRAQFKYEGNEISGDDSLSWSVILDGTKVLVERTEPIADSPPGSVAQVASVEFAVPPGARIVGGQREAPHTITLQFAFQRGANDASPPGVAIVSAELDCASPGYGYLSGTSQAAPQVTGTAGLMFSLDPSATVTQVRNALLAGVDKVPSLEGKVVTGGVLNAWKALAALVPMDTRITSAPGPTTCPPDRECLSPAVKSSSATFTFDTNNTGDADFQCQLDGGPFLPCTSPETYSRLQNGSHTFAVRSAVAGGFDATPASTEWNVAVNTVAVTDPGGQASTVGTPLSPQIEASDSESGQTLTYSATGLPAGLSISSSSGLISGTPTTAGSGSVTVTATDATGVSGSTSFSWTVNPATLTVTAENQSRLFGLVNPPLTYKITGYVNNDNGSVVSGSPACGTTATAASPGGSYPITCSIRSLSAANYTFAFAPGTLTIGYSRTITGSVSAAVSVASGQAVELGPGAAVHGPVSIAAGASLNVEGATISGALSASQSAMLRICGSTLSAPLGASGDTGAVLIGDGTSGCPKSTISGPVTLKRDSGGVSIQNAAVSQLQLTGCAGGVIVTGNNLAGPLTVTENAGGPTVTGNTVNGPLTVTGNTGTVIDRPNTVFGPSKLQ